MMDIKVDLLQQKKPLIKKPSSSGIKNENI